MASLSTLLYLCSLNPWKLHNTASSRRQFIPQHTGVNVVLVNRIVFLLGPDSCVTVELAFELMPAMFTVYACFWIPARVSSSYHPQPCQHPLNGLWSFEAGARDLPSPEWLFVRCLITELRKVTKYPQELVSFVEGDVLHGTHFL